MWASTYVLTYADRVEAQQALASLRGRTDVTYAEYNGLRRLDTATASNANEDPDLDSLQHLVDIRAIEAWQVTTGAKTVRVGIIDTGVWLAHPDLAGQFAVNALEDLNGDGRLDERDLNGIDDDGNGVIDDVIGYDFVDRYSAVEVGDYRMPDPFAEEDAAIGGGRGHGTTVAGVVAAQLNNREGGAGVAPGVKLVPLRAFGADGIAEDDDIARAIIYAADNNIDVLNLSFGDVYDSRLLHEAIRYADQRGVVVVASAGNTGGDKPHYPSDYAEVLSVAWLTGDQLGSRATHGLGVDLGAPGSGVYTTLFPHDALAGPLYGRRSGSSVAAPQVAGAAALLRSLKPELSVASIRAILTGTAHDIELQGWDHQSGGGRLDVLGALQRAMPAHVALSTPAQNSGWSGDVLPIRGTVLHPALQAYTISYAHGTTDLDEATWTELTEGKTPIANQQLARWDLGSMEDGEYTIRLQAALRDGRTIEDRRRVVIDRTRPDVSIRELGQALVEGRPGLAIALRADDEVQARLEVVDRHGQSYHVESDRYARDVVLACCAEVQLVGDVQVRLEVSNRSGLTWAHEQPLTLPHHRMDPQYVVPTSVGLPAGYLLPNLTDFDRDGLAEVTLNVYQQGWVGDTLAIYEWAGDRFYPVASNLANVIPRDVGDTDGDGRLELLTQVAGATLLLEQATTTSYPAEASFVDTTGLANPFAPDAVFGASLVDFDGDGRDEMLTHNTSEWRILEVVDGAYQVRQTLANPTTDRAGEIGKNEYQEPEAIIADLNHDGTLDLAVGDADGDLIVYYNDGTGRLETGWFAESDRYQAGSRLASCDLNGDGANEIVAFKQEWKTPTQAGEREPHLGHYEWWWASTDGFRLKETILIPGPTSRHGTVACADLNGDGADELLIVHAPMLAVYGVTEQGRLALRFLSDRRDGVGTRSASIAVGDLDADGRPDIFVGNEAGETALWQTASAVIASQMITKGYALSAQSVYLAWHAPNADSTTVYAAQEGEAFNRLLTTVAQSTVSATTKPMNYRIATWEAGRRSGLSAPLFVRPHDPARLVSFAVSDSVSVELHFDQPMPSAVSRTAIRLETGEHAQSVQRTSASNVLVATFGGVAGQSVRVHLAGLTDLSGTPLAPFEIEVSFPAAARPLLVEQWEIGAEQHVLLGFNAPLEPASIERLTVDVQPHGAWTRGMIDPNDPKVLMLVLDQAVIGQPGIDTAIILKGLESVDGRRLPDEGLALSLSASATSLDQVYAYPNPVYPERQSRVAIVGVPSGATVEVLTALGTVLHRVEAVDGSGQLRWDLQTASGTLAPSGMYLIRVTHGADAVLKKLAVIR